MEPSGPGSHRWQGNRSACPWEAKALSHIRAQVPDAKPYRACRCTTFTGDKGQVREVDPLIAVPSGLYPVEPTYLTTQRESRALAEDSLRT